ncbi:glutaredoxin [Saccharomonospora amisosensis]|uniref:Glutaredoxin n=1 Tax=Saccharomonospora amisosensis TaxID=1128677 RepID=A0A7X5UL15_9PSEU|nr:glutaredoxin domain-containing protein [Saccharomonospora amisosensis]NIJ09930.1 glutaredoxin [Saccharomonospora amisosensis]
MAVEAIEFYWRPGCPFCASLRRRLRKSGLAVREVDIWSDPKGAARVRAAAGGNETVPTVFVGPVALVNPSMSEVTEAVREHAPHLLETATPPRRWFRR